MGLLAAAITLATALTPAEVSCVGVSAADAKRAAAFVFEGVVQKIERPPSGEFAATLEVQRVWKGDVTKEMTVYYIQTIEGPVLKEHERRIIFAVRQTPALRKALGIADDSPVRDFWVPDCSGVFPAEESVVRQLGRSWQPEDTSPKLQAEIPSDNAAPHATATWLSIVPSEGEILAVVGDAAGAAEVVDQTLGRELRARFNKSNGAPTSVNVLASQLPEAWLPQIPHVQFRRMANVTAAKDFSEACLRVAAIRSIKMSGDTLTVTVIDGDRCSTAGGTSSLQKKDGRWELAVSGGISRFANVQTHCGCR